MIKKSILLIMCYIGIVVALLSCKKNNIVDTNIISTGVNSNDYNSKNETLIVFFSQTGVTKEKANIIREYLYADMLELKLKNPYTFEDINNETTSRAYIEQLDGNSRPEIINLPKNINKYKNIFIGFPIWYGKAPRAIITFLDSFNFNNKKLIFFCTSDNDGIENSMEEIANLKNINNDSIIEQIRFDKNIKVNEIIKWIDSLNLDIKYDDYINDNEYETMPTIPDDVDIE